MPAASATITLPSSFRAKRGICFYPPLVIPSEARNLLLASPCHSERTEESVFTPLVIPSEARNLLYPPLVIPSETRNLLYPPLVIPSEARNLLLASPCHSERSEESAFSLPLSFRAKRGICFLPANSFLLTDSPRAQMRQQTRGSLYKRLGGWLAHLYVLCKGGSGEIGGHGFCLAEGAVEQRIRVRLSWKRARRGANQTVG
jgi:hypothetical protein